METSSIRTRRHRNPQHISDVQNENTEHAAPFFSNGQEAQTTKKSAFFQPKLTIGKVNDSFEKEADVVADKVVHQTNTETHASSSTLQKQKINALQRLATPDEEKMPATNDGRMAEDKRIQEKPIQRMENAEKKEEIPPSVQKVEAPKEEEKSTLQKAEKKEELPIQAKGEAGMTIGHGSGFKIQRTVKDCEDAHAAYKAYGDCRACSASDTPQEHADKVACFTNVIAGRRAYLDMNCDFILPTSIKRGSDKARNGHQLQLDGLIKSFEKCNKNNKK